MFILSFGYAILIDFLRGSRGKAAATFIREASRSRLKTWPSLSADTELCSFTRHRWRESFTRYTCRREDRPSLRLPWRPLLRLRCSRYICVLHTAEVIWARWPSTWSKLTRFGSSELINFQSRQPVLVVKLPLLPLLDRGIACVRTVRITGNYRMFDMELENSTFVKGTPCRHLSAKCFSAGFRGNYPHINIQRERTIGRIPFGQNVFKMQIRCASAGRGKERDGRFSRRKNSKTISIKCSFA